MKKNFMKKMKKSVIAFTSVAALLINIAGTNLTTFASGEVENEETEAETVKEITDDGTILQKKDLTQLDEATQEPEETIQSKLGDVSSENGNMETMILEAGTTIKAQGKCGDNATYSLYTDGTLVVAGTGAMYSYDYDWTNIVVQHLGWIIAIQSKKL